VRTVNEDCIAVGEWCAQKDMRSPQCFEQTPATGLVALVADGMGGHPAGDVASQYATRRLAELLPETRTEQEMAFAVRQANAGLYAEMCREPRWAAMGTAVAGLMIHAGHVMVFNVGDVRAYRINSGRLAQLSVDDGMDPDWQPGSLLPRSGMLTQCLGGLNRFLDVTPHVRCEPCRAGDIYLICSDGLHEVLAADDIAALIDSDLASSTQELFDAAIEAGSTDNISIVLVRVEPARKRHSRRPLASEE